jgi:hypothetical protein
MRICGKNRQLLVAAKRWWSVGWEKIEAENRKNIIQ